MDLEIYINGPLLGKLRKLLRKLHLGRLARIVANVESWHYRCKRMEKKGYYRLFDLRLYFCRSGLSIWTPAFHKWIHL